MFHVKHPAIVLARRIGRDVRFRRVGYAHRSLHFNRRDNQAGMNAEDDQVTATEKGISDSAALGSRWLAGSGGHSPPYEFLAARPEGTIWLESIAMATYEQLLDADRAWAFMEGSRYFERRSRIHLALRELAGRLDQLEIDYAVAGTLAFFLHGYRRFSPAAQS